MKRIYMAAPKKIANLETHMEKDIERNRMLVSMIRMAHEAKRKTIIFTNQIEHLKTLREMTIKAGIHHGDTGLYIGATTKAEIEERERAVVRPLVFATYGMMGEGTDLPWFDTVILAIPRSNVLQPVGRIRREFEGKKEPVVMDLIDLDSPVLTGYAVSRKQWYKSIGCEVKDMF